MSVAVFAGKPDDARHPASEGIPLVQNETLIKDRTRLKAYSITSIAGKPMTI